jgi:glutathione S-transferase
MASQLKPLKVWGQGGPNPPKVVILLEELSIPYEFAPINIADVKKPEYVAINPNGRLPSIHDPNTDITVWESGAIIEYLIEHYDKERKLSFEPLTADSAHAKQWLFFQTTGQGPYYGQYVFFLKYHHDDLPSARERFAKEINRVTGVLEGWLEKQEVTGSNDGPWLVGSKFSYADLAFFPWQHLAGKLLDKEVYNVENYPHVKAWMERMIARPSVKKAFNIE